MRTTLPAYARMVPPQAERVFKGVIYDVYHWEQPMFDGRVATFEMLRRPDTILILGVKDDKIIMINEEQPYNGSTVRLPGGRNDVESEDELACAQREMREETGLIFNNWRLLQVYQPAPKIEAFVYIFLATDFKDQVEPQLDGGEKIKLHPMPINQAIKYLNGHLETKNILEQAKTVNGLLAMPDVYAG